ncbi:hypothetical protein QYS48_32180 [Marivirga arenosa]|uniref:Glycoside hydrolase family 57 N-terminal domain-containing protein n=1 Tax=Marivirga arenosa TaxID=3059076 RepID=A0AA51N4W4_9BACT|nr:hypothetical protein [Marivirga sp. ABR2-2]WMN06312.1 hypothetical protein QYS48_32180 [Marivirga sp. ABR2-2]
MDNYQIIHFNHPLKLKELSFLDIGKGIEAIDESKSTSQFKSNFQSNILPQLKKVLKMAKEDQFPIIYFSIPFLEALKKEDNNTLLEITKAVNKGKIQVIGSCYFHSFSYLCSPILFRKEAELYLKALHNFFDQKPGLFINTACLYDDTVAEIISSMGYQAIIATANPWHLAGKHSGQVYRSNTKNQFNVLLSNGDGPDDFQISLINAYGSAYEANLIDDKLGNSHQMQELFMHQSEEEHSVYAVSLPLSSPSWQHKIPDYTNNPLQKALLKQISNLVKEHASKLKEEDLKLLMLLVQPDHLLQINQTTKEDGYNNFISSMNWITDISLRNRN